MYPLIHISTAYAAACITVGSVAVPYGSGDDVSRYAPAATTDAVVVLEIEPNFLARLYSYLYPNIKSESRSHG